MDNPSYLLLSVPRHSSIDINKSSRCRGDVSRDTWIIDRAQSLPPNPLLTTDVSLCVFISDAQHCLRILYLLVIMNDLFYNSIPLYSFSLRLLLLLLLL